MTTSAAIWPWLLAAVLLTSAAVVAVWPAGPGLGRLSPGRRRRALPSFDLSTLSGLVTRRPHRVAAGAAAGAALPALLVGGPVAAAVGAIYTALGVRAVTRRVAGRREARERAGNLDEVSALAADLRAGLGFRTAPAIGGRLGELVAAAQRLSDRTGAPTADLVDRIEADARAADRARATAAAQAAGAQATAILLAALPLGGIALGYGIGADPLRVLFHTPVGAACAVGAALLQAAGLFWADRLTAGATP